MATALRKLSQVPTHTGAIDPAATVVFQPPAAATRKATVAELITTFNVKWFGAVGDGVTDDQAAVQNADAAAALVGGTVVFPAGVYNCPELEHSSGVTWRALGDVTLLNCYVSCVGSVGEEIAFTGAVAAGDTSLPIPATGLDGEWLRIASVINCGSPDAGLEQLGNLATDDSYLAEFVRVRVGGGAAATLYGRTEFSYSNTPGADTYGSYPTSVARVVTFHEGGEIVGFKFVGKNAAKSHVLYAQWAKGLRVKDCRFDVDDQTAHSIHFDYCLDCRVIGGEIIGKNTGTGAVDNCFVMACCQDCSGINIAFERGYQCGDITYLVDDHSYRGGPSIDCGFFRCRALGAAVDGFCDHQGCLRSFFEACVVRGSQTGVRVRSRGSMVNRCRCSSKGGTGAGVLIMGAALFDSDVAHNRITGFGFGVEFRSSETGYNELRALLGGSQAAIEHNTISNTSAEGIVCVASPALATFIGPAIRYNRVRNPGDDGIEIGSYVNGAIVEGNRVRGIVAGKRGIRWASNTKRLWIDGNHVYDVDAAGFGWGGSAVGSMMTDTTTFPGGETEAELFLGRLFTDAATPATSIVRVSACYLQPAVAGWQPNVAGVGASAPALEMSSLGWYLNGTEVFGKSVDTAGGTTRTYALVLARNGTPEAAIVAPVGTLCIDTSTGTLYAKTSGVGNTGWVKVSAT